MFITHSSMSTMDLFIFTFEIFLVILSLTESLSLFFFNAFDSPGFLLKSMDMFEESVRVTNMLSDQNKSVNSYFL